MFANSKQIKKAANVELTIKIKKFVFFSEPEISD